LRSTSLILDDTGVDWVVQLGPQDYLDEPACAPCYSYAVVSDANNLFLAVLARSPTDFVNYYNTTVYNELIAQGFTKSYNSPIVSCTGLFCPLGTFPSQLSLLVVISFC
jgi:hypothetical protein